MNWNLAYIKLLRQSLIDEGHQIDSKSEDCSVCIPHFSPNSYYGKMIDGTVSYHNMYTNYKHGNLP